MKVHRWRDLRKTRHTAEELKELDEKVAEKILELDLKALRELLGKTQQELAKATKMSQPEISRSERRGDHRLSTLRRIVKALGGDLEVVATFGDKRVRLHGAG